jgi:hypothetical protein
MPPDERPLRHFDDERYGTLWTGPDSVAELAPAALVLLLILLMIALVALGDSLPGG